MVTRLCASRRLSRRYDRYNFEVERNQSNSTMDASSASLAAAGSSSPLVCFRDIILWDLFAVKSLLKVAIFPRQSFKSIFFDISLINYQLLPAFPPRSITCSFYFWSLKQFWEILYRDMKKYRCLVEQRETCWTRSSRTTDETSLNCNVAYEFIMLKLLESL